MFFAGFKRETDWPEVATFLTKEARDKWVRAEQMREYGEDFFEDVLFMREPLTEEDVVQRFGLDSIAEIETLDEFEEEVEGVRFLTVAGMDGWEW